MQVAIGIRAGKASEGLDTGSQALAGIGKARLKNA